jgi:L-fucose isomerase-like protein
MKKQLTFGVIVGSRGFFPHHLAKEGREDMIAVLSELGYNSIVLSPEQTQHGAVQTPDDARHCAELFKKHADAIDRTLGKNGRLSTKSGSPG